ncbi:peptidylprolyl isomerase [Hydrogenophaga sp.]|uniref:peptidylprolyl isomerase n=1 Tax=Hydrogenophaga sp. TaxID=1904254 RepID=UPI00286D9CAB|nr:peptidylprolyl isomerase [Hydrogenophaga sp.]
MTDRSSTGCGSAHCACSGQMQIVPASINGIALHEPGEALDAETLRERAYAELLRQRAVFRGLLPGAHVLVAPELNAAERHVLEAMTDEEVTCPEPTDDECRRYYDANKPHFIVGQALHVRHILFAVTPGVNVHALTQRAEAALLELARKDVPPGRFEQLAAELSNCPSSAEGGSLGWVSPEDCAPELANELFFQTDSRWGMGVHPRLVHTRFGLHIIEVLGRKKGNLPAYEDVAESIRQRLQHQSRATALRQYMRLLVGQAKVEGIELDGADSPLVQ